MTLTISEAIENSDYCVLKFNNTLPLDLKSKLETQCFRETMIKASHVVRIKTNWSKHHFALILYTTT